MDAGRTATLAGATAGTIGEMLSLAVSGQKRDAIDLTTADSADQFRVFAAGMADAGEITMEVGYDGSNEGVGDKLNTAFQAGTPEVWTLTFPDTSTFACSGFITNLGMATAYNEGVKQQLTIKLTGKPTFTDAAA
jgi:predicted secreted protein